MASNKQPIEGRESVSTILKTRTNGYVALTTITQTFQNDESKMVLATCFPFESSEFDNSSHSLLVTML